MDIKKDKKGKNNTDASTCKGSIELYAMINENGINRIRDRITPSASIALTKAQRTRQLSKQEEERLEEMNQFKKMQELYEQKYKEMKVTSPLQRPINV